MPDGATSGLSTTTRRRFFFAFSVFCMWPSTEVPDHRQHQAPSPNSSHAQNKYVNTTCCCQLKSCIGKGGGGVKFLFWGFCPLHRLPLFCNDACLIGLGRAVE